MNLRPELMPPVLDEALVARLAKLADQLDGNPDEDKRAEFNRLAGTDIPSQEFQGIYGGDDHTDYVRRVLYRQQIEPAFAIATEQSDDHAGDRANPDRQQPHPERDARAHYWRTWIRRPVARARAGVQRLRGRCHR